MSLGQPQLTEEERSIFGEDVAPVESVGQPKLTPEEESIFGVSDTQSQSKFTQEEHAIFGGDPEESEEGKIKRLSKSFATGALSSIKSLLGDFKRRQEPLRESLKEVAPDFKATEDKLTPLLDRALEETQILDPSFDEKVASGFGSAASFVLPGLGASKIAKIANLTPKIAALFGTTASAVLESSAEAGSTYESALSVGKTEDEANKDANQVFYSNLPVNFLLDRWIFNKIPEGKKLITAIKGSGQEAAQEAIQQAISNVAINDEIFTPETFKGVPEAAAIGGIVGGGLAGVKSVAEQREIVEENPEDIHTIPSPEPEVVEASNEAVKIEEADTPISPIQEEVIEEALPEDAPPIEQEPVTIKKKNPVIDFAQRYFTTRGDLPKVVFDDVVKRRANISAEIQKARFNLKDFNTEVKKLDVTAEDSLHFDAVLKGEALLDPKFKSVEGPLVAMREHIDRLSKQLIESGAIQGDLKGIVDKNLGTWITRAYRVHTDPKWVEKVPVDVRNRARSYLREELEEQNLSAGEIEGVLNELLNKQEVRPMSILAKGGKEGSKALGILKKRKAIPVEVRDLWGEYKDVPTNYLKSVENVSHIVTNQNFLTKIKDDGLGVFFHEAPVVKDGVDYSHQIATEGSDAYAPLNGIYTSKEINEALNKTSEYNSLPPYMRFYMKYFVAPTKFSKTILSHVTHIRNFQSNIFFSLANANFNPSKLGNAVKATGTQLLNLNDQEYRAYVEKMIRLGVIDESVNAQTMKDIIQDSTIQDIDEFTDKSLNPSIVRKGLKFITNLYQSEDNFWKVFNFENEKSKLKESFPERSEESIDDQAAQIVRDTTPTYSLIPEAAKQFRRFPFVGSFVSFPSEVIRTSFNTLELIKEELADPKRRKFGAQRLAGTLMAATWTSMFAYMSRNLLGMDKDDDEAIRKLAPPWSENSPLLYVGLNKETKNYKYIDLGYTDPYTYLKKPLIAFMRGGDWKKSIVESTSELFSPFLSEDIASSVVFDLARNTDQRGFRIYNPQDSGKDIAEDISARVWKAIEPGTISSMKRVVKGLLPDDTNIYGKKYDPKAEALASFTGTRIMNLDVKRSFEFKARQFKKDLALAQFASKRDDLKAKEVALTNVYLNFIETIDAAKKLGATDQELFRIMKGLSVGKRKSKNILKGRIDFEIDRTLSNVRKNLLK